MTDESLDWYLKSINKTPLLSREKEKELSIRIQNGDSQAKQELINANLRYAVSIAKRYQGLGLPLMDLIQEANRGVIRAAEKFDYGKGRFTTYSIWWIKQTISRELTKFSGAIKIPFNKDRELKEIEKNLGKGYSINETYDKTTLSVKESNYLLNLSGQAASLDQEVSNNGEFENLLNFIGDFRYNPERFSDKKILGEKIVSIMKENLSEKEADILGRIFGIYRKKETVKEISESYNVTKQRIYQIHQRALRKLGKNPKVRKQLEDFLYEPAHI